MNKIKKMVHHVNSRKKLNSHQLKLMAAILNASAWIITVVHVLLIHSKLQVVDEGAKGEVVLNNREHIERALIILAMILFLISFALAIYAENISKQEMDARFHILSKYVKKDLVNMDKEMVNLDKEILNQKVHISS